MSQNGRHRPRTVMEAVLPFVRSPPVQGGSPVSAAWERRTRRWALGFAALALFVSWLAALVLVRAGAPRVAAWALPWPAAAGVYVWHTGVIRRRRAILHRPFPPEWEAVLQREVGFFRALAPDAQERFRRQLQVFLGEKRITGITVATDTTTQVLAAASAIIPIFGFPEWEWHQIGEVLIYPNRFDREFQFGDARGHDILGMVGTGNLNRVMILSKPDLLEGFRNPTDKRNVGLHEFAHLLDKSDGVIDGIPGIALVPQAIGPWVELIRRKMAEIEHGASDIHPYALSSEAEFFAVAAEYFFEQPTLMQRKHPGLYAALAHVFNQNPSAMWPGLSLGQRRFGRNSPCPCGSGRKFKHCCRARL